MSIRQYLSFIWARRWLVVLVAVVVGSAGGGLALRQPKQYTAQAQLVLDTRPDPVLGGFSSAVGMTTQLEILKSEKVAYRVADALLADKSAEAAARLTLLTRGKPLEARNLVLPLQIGMAAEAVRGSNIIAVDFTGPDPVLAVTAANAFAKAAIDTSVELRVEPTRESAEWLTGQTKVLRGSLEQAQAKLSAYQQEKGIVVSDERMTQELARLNALESALVLAEAQRLDVLGRQNAAINESSPEVAQSIGVQSLKTQLSAAQAKLAEAKGTLGSDHPVRIQLEAQIASLREQLAAEVRRVVGGTSMTTRASTQKVEEMRHMVEAQKAAVLSLRSQRDEIAVLQRDVETAQRAYDNASQRAGQLSLESQNTQTSVRMLSPSVEATDASQRKLMIKLLASLAAGVALGLCVAIALELRDWRVRTIDDLDMQLGVPVLGVLRATGSRQQPFFQGLPMELPRSGTPLLPRAGASS